MADDERLAVLIEARVAEFERSLKGVERRVNKMGGNVTGSMKGVERASKRAANTMEKEFSAATAGVSKKIAALRNGFGGARNLLGSIAPTAGLAGLLGGAGIGGAAAAITSVTKSIADMAAEAKRAGLSFAAFQELDFAFDRERVSIDALTDGIKELQLRADEFAVTGKGSAAEAFTRLGYGAEELKRKLKDPQDLLLEIIGRLEKFDKAAQIRIADEVFGGTGGEQFVQLLDAGEGKLRENIQRARDLGVVLSDDVAARAAEVNAKFEELVRIISGKLKSGITALGGLIADLGTEIGQVVDAANRFAETVGQTTPAGRLREIEGNLYQRAEAERELQRGRDAAAAARFGRDIDLGIPQEYLDTVERTTDEFADQNDEIAKAEQLLGRAQAQVQHFDSLGDKLKADEARADVEALRQELERLRQALGTIRLDPIVVDQGPTLSGNHPTTGLPQPVAGTMGAHGQRLVRINTASGRSAMVNAEHATNFQGLIDDLEAQGYVITSLGGYNNRNIAGTNTLSNHAFGNAIDINPAQNPMGDRLVTDLPVNVAELARKHGLSWGGNWQSRKDAMHFEAPGSGTERELQRAAQSAETDRAKVAEDAMRQAEALQRVNEELARELEIENQRAELQAAGFSQEQINNALDEEALVREKLNQLKAAGIEVDAQQEEKIRALVSQLFELRDATDQAAAAQQKLEQAQQDVGAAAQAIGQPILDTLLSLGDGAEDAGEKFKQLAKQIANMVLQGALFGQGPLSNLFGGGLLGGLLGRASGGPVRAGQPYMVGEQGKELFVPGANGTILDANRTKSMMDRMMTPSMAGGSAASGTRERVIEKVIIAGTVTKDGGLETFVESVASPIARAESRKASDRVARSVPSIADARSHDKETRKTRTLRGWGVPD
ncbi:M15 family metallopeptidase [Acuticoccus sediminis]|uniref:M15 family metallopeptidase n=1 Tax=Acuticoccus sediminis TaxID=2184697 RepID=UPI00192E3530|nr:M15 family metallopeptidase [Acuticoccus sediminis]